MLGGAASTSLSINTNLFVTAVRGMNEAIIVRSLVGLVMSLKPMNHGLLPGCDSRVLSTTASSTHHRGKAPNSGFWCCTSEVSAFWPWRTQFSSSTMTLAARWSKACTILASYSGKARFFALA